MSTIGDPTIAFFRGSSLRREFNFAVLEPSEQEVLPETAPRHQMIIQNLNSVDDSAPIPIETLRAIYDGKASLKDFSKMSIFNTLYSA